MNRSASSLLSVYLEHKNMAETDLIQCLQDMPHMLTSLDLSTFHITDKVLDLLTVGSFETEGRGCMLPHLECIALGCPINPSEGKFADMVESRMRDDTSAASMQISRLCCVIVVFEGRREDEDRLLRLRNGD
jgi:hypothetical protein